MARILFLYPLLDSDNVIGPNFNRQCQKLSMVLESELIKKSKANHNQTEYFFGRSWIIGRGIVLDILVSLIQTSLKEKLENDC